jgi:hypothetical protein
MDEDKRKMKSILRQRKIKLIDDLIKNKRFDVNVPLNKLNHPTLFHFMLMILTQHDRKIEFRIMESIIEGKANINYVNDGLDVLTLIYKHKKNIEAENIIELLLKNKANNYNLGLKKSALDYAVESGCGRSIRLLLKNGVVPNETIFDKYNGYLFYDNIHITKLLFEYMPDDFLFKKKFTFCVLGCAIVIGCLNVFRRYVIHGVINVNIACRSSWLFVTPNIIKNKTPLEIVLLNIKEIKKSPDNPRCNILGDGKDLNNYIEIAKSLIDYGGDTNEIKLDETISSYAISRKNTVTDCLFKYFPKVLMDIIICYTKN